MWCRSGGKCVSQIKHRHLPFLACHYPFISNLPNKSKPLIHITLRIYFYRKKITAMFKIFIYSYTQTLLHLNRFISFLTSFSSCLDTKRNRSGGPQKNQEIPKLAERRSLRSNSGISGWIPKDSEISKSIHSKSFRNIKTLCLCRFA